MKYILAQYILIIILIIAVCYFLYLVKNKSQDYLEDYYGLSDIIINTEYEDEKSKENIKKVLRAVYKGVSYVEKNYKELPNHLKETRALEISKNILKQYKFKGNVNEHTLIYIIRINCALMKETNK